MFHVNQSQQSHRLHAVLRLLPPSAIQPLKMQDPVGPGYPQPTCPCSMPAFRRTISLSKMCSRLPGVARGALPVVVREPRPATVLPAPLSPQRQLALSVRRTMLHDVCCYGGTLREDLPRLQHHAALVGLCRMDCKPGQVVEVAPAREGFPRRSTAMLDSLEVVVFAVRAACSVGN